MSKSNHLRFRLTPAPIPAYLAAGLFGGPLLGFGRGFSVTNRNVTDYNRTSPLTRAGDIVITSGEKRSLTTSIPTMDPEVTAVLEAYKAFRDKTNEDAYLKIQDKNPGLEALFDALMDLEQASED